MLHVTLTYIGHSTINDTLSAIKNPKPTLTLHLLPHITLSPLAFITGLLCNIGSHVDPVRLMILNVTLLTPHS